MKIEKDKVVTVTYELHSSPENITDRTHIESADSAHPMIFLFGAGNLIPEFENNLAGKSPGDSFEFSINAENAYGKNNADEVIPLPIDIFKTDGVLDLKMLSTGNIVPLTDDEGNHMNGKVVKVDGNNVLIDFNHPLAGHDLHFKGKVTDVRDATAGELSHGHVHTGHEGH